MLGHVSKAHISNSWRLMQICPHVSRFAVLELHPPAEAANLCGRCSKSKAINFLYKLSVSSRWVGAGKYELMAVLTHKGRSADSGHYVAWVKQDDKQWIQFDDDELIPRKEVRSVFSRSLCQ